MGSVQHLGIAERALARVPAASVIDERGMTNWAMGKHDDARPNIPHRKIGGVDVHGTADALKLLPGVEQTCRRKIHTVYSPVERGEGG